MVKAPCKDCEKRNPYCHTSCKAYKDYRAEKDRENEAIHTIRRVNAELTRANIERNNKWMKKQRKKK